MKVTDVRVRVVKDRSAEKLRGFATITFDDEFVVRDLKIIEGHQGLFIAMPSRKIMERCPKCSTKNPAKSNYCSECGARMPDRPLPAGSDGRAKLHVDVAHPVTPVCRELVHKAVVGEYEKQCAAGVPVGVSEEDDEDA